MQYIINKLPEVIKCIIFDYVSYTLNYYVELSSDKFIGNPIDLFKKNIYNIEFYHVNKLTDIIIPLHFIGLRCGGKLPPNKITKIFICRIKSSWVYYICSSSYCGTFGIELF